MLLWSHRCALKSADEHVIAHSPSRAQDCSQQWAARLRASAPTNESWSGGAPSAPAAVTSRYPALLLHPGVLNIMTQPEGMHIVRLTHSTRKLWRMGVSGSVTLLVYCRAPGAGSAPLPAYLHLSLP